MGRASTRQNKTPYQLAREELGLSRERAAELLETIPAERIERIESERSLPRPDEVLRMAQRYKKPSLCNAYCARVCPIGQEYVPEIKPKELPAIVLEMLATLNTLDRERGCLIDISADGSIDPDELADFLRIQRELEQISRTVEATYFAALPKPGVWSVSTRSLSMVLGMPMNRTSLPVRAAKRESLSTVSMESFPPT